MSNIQIYYLALKNIIETSKNEYPRFDIFLYQRGNTVESTVCTKSLDLDLSTSNETLLRIESSENWLFYEILKYDNSKSYRTFVERKFNNKNENFHQNQN